MDEIILIFYKIFNYIVIQIKELHFNHISNNLPSYTTLFLLAYVNSNYFSQKKFLNILYLSFATIIALITINGFLFMIKNIGYDSILETYKYNFAEAVFFLKNFIYQLYNIFFKIYGLAKVFKYILFLVLLTCILIILKKYLRWNPYKN